MSSSKFKSSSLSALAEWSPKSPRSKFKPSVSALSSSPIDKSSSPSLASREKSISRSSLVSPANISRSLSISDVLLSVSSAPASPSKSSKLPKSISRSVFCSLSVAPKSARSKSKVASFVCVSASSISPRLKSKSSTPKLASSVFSPRTAAPANAPAAPAAPAATPATTKVRPVPRFSQSFKASCQ